MPPLCSTSVTVLNHIHTKRKGLLFQYKLHNMDIKLKLNATNYMYLPGSNMGVVPPSRQWGTGREIKGTETCALTMTREGARLMTAFKGHDTPKKPKSHYIQSILANTCLLMAGVAFWHARTTGKTTPSIFFAWHSNANACRHGQATQSLALISFPSQPH